MGLRDEWESEDNNANEDCRVWKWLSGFADDDRSFLMERLGNPSVSTEGLATWLKRKKIQPADISRLNNHRRRRCTCPDEYGGRIA